MTWLLVPVAAYAVLISIYILAVTLGAWLYRPARGRSTRTTRFAVVVPAHNEGEGILATLGDLKRCDYPAERHTTFVIADNCTDDTASIARAAGATVMERHDLSLRGKGPALDWFLKSQAQTLQAYDVIVFIDADMFVDSRFLAELDAVFAAPEVQVAQGRYTVANPRDSFFSAFTFLSFAWVNHLRPAGRCWLGGSAGLKGSGMAFRSELILRTGWPAASIAEDLEFGKELVLRGTRIHYASDAIVTSNVGGRLRQVTTQQSRWEGGKARVTWQYFPPLLKRLRAGFSALVLDELLDSLIPPLSLVIALILIGSMAGWLAGSTLLILPFAFMALVFGASVLSALWQLRAPMRVLLLLAAAPVFVLFKLALLAKLAVSRHASDWKRTPRDAEKP